MESFRKLAVGAQGVSRAKLLPANKARLDFTSLMPLPTLKQVEERLITEALSRSAGNISRAAEELGISWHLLADGDEAGMRYADTASAFLGGAPPEERITRLPESDMEHYLWTAGYAAVYQKATRAAGKRRHGKKDKHATLERAINVQSKPFLALSIIEACAAPDSPGIPPVLKATIDAVVHLARTN